MTRVVVWVVALALGIACNKPKPQQASTQQPMSLCPKVADHLVGLMSGATKHPPEATDPLRRVIDQRCEQDAWTADTKQCLLALESLSAGDRCQAMMTKAQIEAFHRDSEAATVELRNQFNENPPPNTPATYVGSAGGGGSGAASDAAPQD